MSQGEVAIEAKHPEAKGIVVLFEPVVELPSTNLIAHYLAPVFISMTVHMVNRKKLRPRFFTASTQCATICIERSRLDRNSCVSVISVSFKRMCLPPTARVFVPFVTMSFSIFYEGCSYLLWILRSISSCLLAIFFFIPWHKNAASPQLAAVTRQAGDRQLEVSIA